MSFYDVLIYNLGILDFDDFLTLMTKKMTEKDETEDLQKAFWLFDEDGTGKISRANLDRVAIELGYDPDKMQDELQVYTYTNRRESHGELGRGQVVSEETTNQKKKKRKRGIFWSRESLNVTHGPLYRDTSIHDVKYMIHAY